MTTVPDSPGGSLSLTRLLLIFIFPGNLVLIVLRIFILTLIFVPIPQYFPSQLQARPPRSSKELILQQVLSDRRRSSRDAAPHMAQRKIPPTTSNQQQHSRKYLQIEFNKE